MSEINSSLFPVDIQPNAPQFEANGRIYTVDREVRLSVDRDWWLEKFSIGALTGRDGMAILREIRRAYDALNAGTIVDAGVILDNVMRGAADLNAKEAPLYYICTLFINREDENRRHYDLELAKQKIADWRAAGINSDFFKASALNYLSITGAHLNTLMETFSGINLPELSLSDQGPQDPFDSN
ncbi:hypothetical protein [Spirosoma litoris]